MCIAIVHRVCSAQRAWQGALVAGYGSVHSLTLISRITSYSARCSGSWSTQVLLCSYIRFDRYKYYFAISQNYQRCPSLNFLLEPEPSFFGFVFLGEPEPELFWFSIFVGARARACFSLSFGWSRSQSFFGFGFLGEPDLELSLAPSFGWSQSKDSAFLGHP